MFETPNGSKLTGRVVMEVKMELMRPEMKVNSRFSHF